MVFSIFMKSAIITVVNFRKFLLPQKETLYTSKINFLPPHLPS